MHTYILVVVVLVCLCGPSTQTPFTMDFSKVRLADFVRSSLREEPQAPPSTSIASPQAQNVPVAQPTDTCARAPQYTIDLTPFCPILAPKADDVFDAEHDAASGYCIGILQGPESNNGGVYVWKPQSENTLCFPISLPASMPYASFVPPNLQLQVHEPGLLIGDRSVDYFGYWRTISETIATPDMSSIVQEGKSDSLSNSICLSGKLPCKIAIYETVHPFGAVISDGKELFLLNLIDESGHPQAQLTKMKAKSQFFTYFARSTSSATSIFGSDSIRSVRSGRFLRGEQGDYLEVFVLKEFGDLSVWHISYGGYNKLVREVRVASDLHMQINMLYPNSSTTLWTNSVAVDADMYHVVASFVPDYDIPGLRYLVVISYSHSDPDYQSVYRIQSYEGYENIERNIFGKSHARQAAYNEEIGQGVFPRIYVSNGVLVIVTDTGITFVDTPARQHQSRNGARWEETIAFKPDVSIIKDYATYSASYAANFGREDLGVGISTTYGFLQIKPSVDRDIKSTTQARLEQAVFESSDKNPLDFTKWSKFCAQPDDSAIDELSEQIATANTPFLPKELPNLGAHLEMRASALKKMYKLTEEQNVRELAQSLEAAHSLYVQYTESSPEVQRTIDDVARGLGGSSSLVDYLKANILETPKLLNALASNALASQSSPLAHILLELLLTCDSTGIGMPHWATCQDSSLRATLEALTHHAVDSKDVKLLCDTCELLCAFTSVETPDGANNDTIKKLLLQLSEIGGSPNEAALKIAAKYRVYSALAPLEVAIWLEGGNINDVVSHIAEFGDVYASAVFETCITHGHSLRMVTELAPHYPQLIDDYLNAHKLHNIAWTLQPRSFQSTVHLSLATREAQNNYDRTIFASLYKLSAYFTQRPREFNEANNELKLAKAQDVVEEQFAEQSPHDFDSAIIKHNLSLLPNKVLDQSVVVDMLALAPAVLDELVSNLTLAFSLVSKRDVVRQQLLVQQLVCNTDWISLAEEEEGSMDFHADEALQDTLFYHIYKSSDPETAEKLLHFTQFLVDPQVDDVRQSYPWDNRGIVVKELTTIAKRARDITEKFDVKRWVERLRDL